MDVLQLFLPYVGVNPQRLNMHIERHPCLEIARKYASLSEELARARMATLGAASITDKGAVKIEDRPGMSVLQQDIKELEARVAGLQAIARQYGEALEAVGSDPLDSQQDPREMLRALVQKTEIQPAAWQEFNRKHGQLGNALPSEVLADPEYAEFEGALIAKRDSAQGQIPPIREAIRKLEALSEEARSL